MKESDDTAPNFDPHEESTHRPPEHSLDRSLLFDLLGSGNYEATIAEGKRILAEEPEDQDAHFCLILAYVDTNQPKQAKEHLEFLLQAEPDGSNTHVAAVVYFFSRKRIQLTLKHAEAGMRIDPENSFFYYYAALANTSKLRFKKAREFLQRALDLNPEDPDYHNLRIRLSMVDETAMDDSLRRIDELKETLKYDPENAAIHFSLGEVYLDELDAPREAEYHFRQALRTHPADRDYQLSLFNAVGHRDLLYRTLSIPTRTFRWLGYWLHAAIHQPWRFIFVIIGIKAVLAFLAWLILATVLFWPASKVYEWLLVSEIRSGSRSSLKQLQLWYQFHRLPRAFRFGLFIGISAVAYTLAFLWLKTPLQNGFTLLALAIAIHFAGVLTFWIVRRLRVRMGKQRRHRQKEPPPIPSSS